MEIAKICCTFPTSITMASVYVHAIDKALRYRVAVENSDLALGSLEIRTPQPMSLEELTDFLLAAWPLIDFLESEFGDDIKAALESFSVDSCCYADLDRLCRQRVMNQFSPFDEGDACPFCGGLNSPPASDTCTHAVAWVWDGQIEILDQGQIFADALDALNEAIDSATKRIAKKVARDHPVHSKLIKTAPHGIEKALSVLASAQTGAGWSNTGMLGGFNYTIYVADSAVLLTLAEECQACCARLQEQARLEA